MKWMKWTALSYACYAGLTLVAIIAAAAVSRLVDPSVIVAGLGAWAF
jgi:hypothetical protein